MPKVLPVFLALLLVAPLQADPLPQYEIVEVPFPAGTDSWALDLNNREELLGYTMSNQVQVGFIYQGQQITLLTAFGEGSSPSAINNLGQVVGMARKLGEYHHAWLYSNGENIDLTPGLQMVSGASAINDLGDIVGLLSPNPPEFSYAYRFSNPPGRLSPEFPPRVDGSSIDPYVHVPAINNNGAAVGSHFGYGTLWLNANGAQPQIVNLWPTNALMRGFSEARAINSSNHVAGVFAKRNGVGEPGLWIRDDWIPLATPLKRDAFPADINDKGVIVGTYWSPNISIIWQNGAAAKLASFVDLPAGAELNYAVAINNSGVIAATLIQNGSRAVLLRPLNDAPIPSFEITGLSDTYYEGPDLTVSVDTSYVTPTRQVDYTLFRRERDLFESQGIWRTNFTSEAVYTNIVSGADLSTTFTNLGPGAYVMTAELRDGKVTLYSVPRYFIITTPARVYELARTTSRHWYLGLEGSFGRQFEVQTSTNLLDWETLTNSPVFGGSFVYPMATDDTRFVRARTTREHIDLFPDYVSDQKAPRRPTFSGYHMQIDTGLTNENVLFLFDEFGFFKAFNPAWTNYATGTYTYRTNILNGYEATLSMNGNIKDNTQFKVRYALDLEFNPLTVRYPNDYRTGRLYGTHTLRTNVFSVTGTFRVE